MNGGAGEGEVKRENTLGISTLERKEMIVIGNRRTGFRKARREVLSVSGIINTIFFTSV